MFEQSLLIANPANKTWTVIVSLSRQLLFVGAAILVPLVFTEQLSPLKWARTYVAPQLPPPPVAPTATPLTQSRTTSTTFMAPRTIPHEIKHYVDESLFTPAAVPAVGVAGGTGALSAAAGLLGDLIRVTAQPPPAPREPPKQAIHTVPAEPLRVSSTIQAAKLIRKVIPSYPVLAKQARISGTVKLVGTIGKDGTIQNLQLLSGHPLLSQAAFDAVRQWVYRPTLLNGEAVEVIAPIDVVFTLSQ